MKKIFCFFLVGIICNYTVSAQVKVDKNASRNIEKATQPNRNINQSVITQAPVKVMDIELYELPKFNGKKGNFTWQDGKLVPPFALKHISFTVSTGKIVYLKFCNNEFPYEVPYSTSQSDITLAGLCGIRSDDVANFTVQFNGISTVIHNNDCKRIFGEITVKVIEQSVTGNPILFNCTTSNTYKANSTTFKPFSNTSANTTPAYTNYVFAENRGIPNISTVVYGSGAVGTDEATFSVGATALREGKVSLNVTTKIGSAHKSCDLCDDFSSNVTMAAPISETININKPGTRMVDAAHPKVIMGPYAAHGSRDGSAITASGGTNIDFRTHFTVTRL